MADLMRIAVEDAREILEVLDQVGDYLPEYDRAARARRALAAALADHERAGRVSIARAIAELREAGGSDWDDIADPEAFLGREDD